jgi:hypothetical protein
MVSKCANPGCSAPFLYMRQGKVFCIETVDTHCDRVQASASAWIQSDRHLEFFWLCDDCAPRMTVTVKPGLGVVVQPTDRAAVAAAS